jgi:hypothetical protein
VVREIRHSCEFWLSGEGHATLAWEHLSPTGCNDFDPHEPHEHRCTTSGIRPFLERDVNRDLWRREDVAANPVLNPFGPKAPWYPTCRHLSRDHRSKHLQTAADSHALRETQSFFLFLRLSHTSPPSTGGSYGTTIPMSPNPSSVQSMDSGASGLTSEQRSSITPSCTRHSGLSTDCGGMAYWAITSRMSCCM